MLVNPSTGKILLAEPGIQDFYFKQSVILLGELDGDGAFGLIVNKRTNIRFGDIINDHHGLNPYIYLGGPVRSQNLFFIHRLPDLPGCNLITKGVYWGGDSEIMYQMIKNKLITENEVRFFLGYAGWTPNQLETEITEKSWRVTDMSASQIFSSEQSHLWEEEMMRINPAYKVWFNMPADIMNN
ncbi:MAG: YqgE/AlgH family protein [Bacteroidota bacterium]|nr:YqgE/AlgH family protein [Bacteroidota bacterium]